MLVDMHKIRIVESLRNQIAKQLRALNKGSSTSFSVTCYKNGRENGFCIRRYGEVGNIRTSVTFSEARSSDNIVIYFDSDAYIDCIDQASYENAVYIQKEDNAVKICVDHLTENI